MSGYLDKDLLWAVAAAMDAEIREYGPQPDVTKVLAGVFEDPKAMKKVIDVAVSRGTAAAGLFEIDDLEVRQHEVSAAIQSWLDGFMIATRYARERAKPQPMKVDHF